MEIEILEQGGAGPTNMVEIPPLTAKYGKPVTMATTPVTNAQWADIFPEHTFAPEDADLPMVNINWYEAMEYCRRLTLKLRAEGTIGPDQTVTLPTPEDWIVACRAGTTSRFYSGDDEAALDRIAWYQANSGGRMHPVGQKEPNAFGLFDMIGNCWEWTRNPEDPIFIPEPYTRS